MVHNLCSSASRICQVGGCGQIEVCKTNSQMFTQLAPEKLDQISLAEEKTKKSLAFFPGKMLAV